MSKRNQITFTISQDDRDFILLCLGFSAGAKLARGDDGSDRWMLRSMEVANKLGCTYKLPTEGSDKTISQ